MSGSSLILAYLPASSNGLSFRGSEIALFDYMYHAETILGYKSILCLGRTAYNEPLVLKKFQDRFDTILYFDTTENLEAQLILHKVDALYTIRAKPTQGLILQTIPMLIHAVYEMEPPAGLIVAGVSKSVGDPFVPHMVHIHDTQEDYRTVLGIPKEAIVFGRHGGNDTWDLAMAKEAVLRVLETRSDIYFLFAVRPHILLDVSHPRLLCLEVFADLAIKRKFINTCDAMLHAQSLGESYGLSVAEMSMANKPVITWNGGRLQEHLRILGNKCIKYNSAEELYQIMISLDSKEIRKQDWRAYGDYCPELVMKKFDQIFLDPLRSKETVKSINHVI